MSEQIRTDNSAVIERLERREQELVAHVERRNKALDDLLYASEHSSESHYWSESDGPHPWDVARQVLNETPQQSLREIRAEAGREGWIRCAHWMKKAPAGSNVNEAADAYAQQIRSGQDE